MKSSYFILMEYSIILMVYSEQMHADFSFLILSGFIVIDYQAILICIDKIGVDSKLET